MSKKLTIIDYGAGNTFSVASAFKRLGVEPSISDDPKTIDSADFVVLPGVGNAVSAMKQLQEKKLDKLIPTLKQPVLGICLGMQLLCESSEEGNVKGLNVFKGVNVRRFGNELPVPHMGWNELINSKGRFSGITGDVYFVHGFYVPVCSYTVAETDYSVKISAALEKDNFLACQFHPEKSGALGEEVLRRFLNSLEMGVLN